MENDVGEFSKDPEAEQVICLMENGRWRKARDAAKELCKRDRGRYLDLLIRANVGLVREMLAKGLVKEAETVVAYLASFASAETMAMLRVEMAAPTGKRQVEALADSGGAGWWAAALRADQVVLMEGIASPADQAAINLLVTDAFEPTAASDDGRAVRLLEELRAVRLACAATGDGRWEDAKDALRALPRQSLFWQWRIFLRGVRCVFEGDEETARQCFAQLPEVSGLARAASVFVPALAAGVRPTPVTAKIPLFLASTGQPASWAVPILTAVASWKAGKRIQAFDDLASGMKTVFSSVAPGLPALLIDAILPSYARMNEDDWADSEVLYDRFGSGRGKGNSSGLKLAVLRSICVAERYEMPSQELDRLWRMTFELWQDCHGPDPQRDSLAWQWLGDSLKHEAESDFNPFGFSHPKGKRNDLAKALKAYEKSIAADESNEAAWLALASLLIKQGDTKKSNPMLDELVRKFPRSKGILTLAGESALTRKSYAKGAGFLRDALVLDPLDKDLKSRLVVTLTLRVRETSAKGAPTDKLWAEIEPLLEDRPPDGRFMLSRWMARVRRSLFDSDPIVSAQAESDAIAMAPSALVRIFFAAALASVYRIPSKYESKQDWKAACSSSDSTWKSLLEILKILNFTCDISGWGAKQTDAAKERILGVLGHLVSAPMLKEDPEGLLEFYIALQALDKRGSPQISQVIVAVRRHITQALHRHAHPTKRKTNPRLRLANLMIVGHEPKWALKYLAEVITDLQTAGLHALTVQAEALQKEIELQPSRALSGFFGFQSDDDSDDDLDWDDEDEENDEDLENDELSEMEKCMEALKRAIAADDHGAIEKVRKSLRGFGMSKAMIDSAVAILSDSKRSTPPPKPAKKAPNSKTSDPLQIDLF